MVVTIVAVSLAVVFTLGSLGLGTAAVLSVVRRTQHEVQAPSEALEVRIAALEVTVMGLPSLWEEERKRAKRAQDSARKDREHSETIREEIAEAIEGADELRDVDEEGSDIERVLGMRPNMGVPAVAGLHERAAAVAHLMR